MLQGYYYLKLALTKDYESEFDAVTLIQIPEMISLSGFQPLSIAEINILSSTTGVLRKDISVTKSMPFELKRFWYILSCVTVLVSVDSQVE